MYINAYYSVKKKLNWKRRALILHWLLQFLRSCLELTIVLLTRIRYLWAYSLILFYEFNSKAWFAIAYCINVYMLEEGGKWKKEPSTRKERERGKEESWHTVLYTFAIARNEEAPGEPPERDPLSYGHIRDFFRLYLLATVRGKGQPALLNWVTWFTIPPPDLARSPLPVEVDS